MSDTEQYWYNLSTKQVERGFESPAVDRAGPFATAEEAARAPEIMAQRSRAWAEEEAREDGWDGAGHR
ncbi:MULTISPECIES: SPOR domain-containing protein [unclassified Microbacterium]|uniref:SPOR domain-containing protein n=1 Tax=unclassified Microbacterium TaxID=2609290 RepID=UPI00386CE76A